MSRIGKKPIVVPSGVTANIEGQTVNIKGPKGALSVAVHDDVAVKLEGGQIKVDPLRDQAGAVAMGHLAYADQ
jgi:large subunit ribosomal protein L6